MNGHSGAPRLWRRTGPSALATLLLLGVFALADATGAGAAPAVPYTDTSALGYIGLCNQAGQQITTGSVSATPFVWRAVSSQAAPAGYNGANGTATLLAYLPVQSLPAGDWSGEQITASSIYTNPQSPMAEGTAQDVPLQDFLQDYPPQWDGFIQLRMYLDATNMEAYEVHYPVLNLEITGDTWTAVGGGPVNCNAGSARSLAAVLAPPTTTPTTTTTLPSSGTGTNASAATPAASAVAKKPGSAQQSAADANSNDAHGVATAQSASWTHSHAWLLLLVLPLVLIALSILVFARRRRANQLSSTASTTSVKGPQS
jgi:hypothetical protein